jgi:hypothetical protein
VPRGRLAAARDWRSRHRYDPAPGLNRHSATIIPLGPGSLRDSSSLPEGQSTAFLRTRHIRAGPALPSYLALLHAGFSVPRMSPPGRWALTPPFHPCQMRSTETGEPAVLPQACRRVRITPAVYFLWHFPWPRLRVSPSRNARRNPLALPGALPYRRRPLRARDDGSPDFPPAYPAVALRRKQGGRRSSNSPAKVIIRHEGRSRLEIGRREDNATISRVAISRSLLRQESGRRGIWLSRTWNPDRCRRPHSSSSC